MRVEGDDILIAMNRESIKTWKTLILLIGSP